MSIQDEIDTLRSTSNPTLRFTVPALEERLYKIHPVLDHGFIRVIDYMGGDPSIVQAARVSYGRGTKAVSNDRALIRYLVRHRHTSPLEMCEIKVHMKLPIFVARQLIRHRTANVNEVSGRYSIIEDEFYIPSPDQVCVQSSDNKQGRGLEVPPEKAEEVRQILIQHSVRSHEIYQELLNDDGEGNPVDPTEPMLARELSRIGLGVNFYTQWYWKVDLHNLFHFLGLRKDPHAQFEIRVYADVLGDIARDWAPLAWEAFEDYRFHAASFSRMELAGVAASLVEAGVGVEKLRAALKAAGCTGREISECVSKLGL